jgi:small multidrug resistance pump
MSPTQTAYLYLFIAIVAEIIATTALKATEGFTRMAPSLAVICGYGVAFVCLSFTLRTLPVGVAYAIWSGVGMVLISALGWLIYRQALDVAALAGIVLIIAGVLVINLFSKTIGP